MEVAPIAMMNRGRPLLNKCDERERERSLSRCRTMEARRGCDLFSHSLNTGLVCTYRGHAMDRKRHWRRESGREMQKMKLMSLNLTNPELLGNLLRHIFSRFFALDLCPSYPSG